MDINFGDLFNQGKAAVEKSFQDVVNTGVPAIKAGVESQAINWLQDQQKQTQKVLQGNIQAMLKDPNPSNPIVQAFKDAGQSAVLQEKGSMILVGILGIAVVGYLLLRK